ncbi:DNA polymerase IV [uncultured Sphaerochaeta sp.]|uniref:DNA polymerase IV n=1 Tax=uncultured Sphaerochaeta sp. TaxID=886478 RepID=UPI002A0A8D14|nr:DNA polymerase IV [uncultured Sphaerochaeta sp.]
MEQTFFHVDMDAFFAAIEEHDNPEYKGKCLVIGGLGPRSVASTASYAARKFGVHSAMPMGQALRLCPQAIVIPPNMKRYSQVSKKIMQICRSFSPEVQQLSIDEAFLDMTGTRRLFGLPRQAAQTLKAKVLEETGLTISVGIGPSKFIAKMASDYDKPDGLCRVSQGKELAFVDAVGLKKLWGIGKVTQAQLDKHHIGTTEQLRQFSQNTLQSLFGQSMGQFLYNASRGVDPGLFSSITKSHSISSEMTFDEDVTEALILEQYLLQMSHEIMFRSLDEKQMGRTIGIKIRFPDFSTFTCQVTPKANIYSAEQVYATGKQLLSQKWHEGVPVRLLGIGLYQLYNGEKPLQEELFDDPFSKKRELEKIILEMHKKGQEVFKATNLEQHDLQNKE